jgi:transcriptional regulator with XRE-family HTH domain
MSCLESDILCPMNSEELGVRIAKLRRQAGLTQAELAERAGTTQAVISRIESGRAKPGVEMVDRIALAAGRPLKLVFGAQRDPLTREERRARVRQALGDYEFNPWDRDPTPAESRSLNADGLGRERFPRSRTSR